jgi:cyclic pyranopterin phosphate synthase
MKLEGKMDFTHFNPEGRAKMVDVSKKPPTLRTAKAAGKIIMTKDTLKKIKDGKIAKGDVLAVAQVAGIMAAKRTSDMIPMCHPLALTGADITFSFEEDGIAILAKVKCKGETGVEMEALNAISAAALTIYDMCKAVQKDMIITAVRLLEKTGGKSGDYKAKE